MMKRAPRVVISGLLVAGLAGAGFSQSAAGQGNAELPEPEAFVPIVAPATVGVQFIDSDPRNGSINVRRSSSVTLSPSTPVNPASVTAATLIVSAPDGSPVAGRYNSDAAGGIVSFTPLADFPANTRFTVTTTAGILDQSGQPFAPWSSSFTTGTGLMPEAPYGFNRAPFASIPGVTVIIMGPDNRLYLATNNGAIYRYSLGVDGLPSGPPLMVTPFGTNTRTILGLAVDPRSTPTDVSLWVSHNALGYSNMINFTGKVSVVSGAALTVKRDVITGLPRSTKDHMTNAVRFGPTGCLALSCKLFISQSSLSGYGAPDAAWGMREETPLSAAILIADVLNDTRFSTAVNVNTSTGYNATTTTAPVKVYATGIRNAYDMVWHSNGKLYATVNESSAGTTPAGPTGTPIGITGLLAGPDFLAQIKQGKYYGHPNPSVGKYVLNGGNPTVGRDAFEIPQYPLGQLPDPAWDLPVANFGPHRSVNGIDEFTSNVFGQRALKGKLLAVEFSNGDDIVMIGVDNRGATAGIYRMITNLNNPLDIFVNPANGFLYVAEFGVQPNGSGGTVARYAPVPTTSSKVAFIDFGPASHVPPAGYVLDSGAAFSASRGHGWIRVDNRTPLSIATNGRDTNTVADQRLDTVIMTQCVLTTGCTRTPARWEYALANGVYDITVAAGDGAKAVATNIVTVEGSVVIGKFQPTTTTPYVWTTTRVRVSDGFLTVAPATGSVNTKLAYIEIERVTEL